MVEQAGHCLMVFIDPAVGDKGALSKGRSSAQSLLVGFLRSAYSYIHRPDLHVADDPTRKVACPAYLQTGLALLGSPPVVKIFQEACGTSFNQM